MTDLEPYLKGRKARKWEKPVLIVPKEIIHEHLEFLADYCPENIEPKPKHDKCKECFWHYAGWHPATPLEYPKAKEKRCPCNDFENFMQIFRCKYCGSIIDGHNYYLHGERCNSCEHGLMEEMEKKWKRTCKVCELENDDVHGIKIMFRGTPQEIRICNDCEKYNKYISWSKLREEIIVERNFSCERCPYNSPEAIKLELHHKNRNRDDNRKENLELLCKKCHLIEHRKKPRRKSAE